MSGKVLLTLAIGVIGTGVGIYLYKKKSEEGGSKKHSKDKKSKESDGVKKKVKELKKSLSEEKKRTKKLKKKIKKREEYIYALSAMLDKAEKVINGDIPLEDDDNQGGLEYFFEPSEGKAFGDVSYRQVRRKGEENDDDDDVGDIIEATGKMLQ